MKIQITGVSPEQLISLNKIKDLTIHKVDTNIYYFKFRGAWTMESSIETNLIRIWKGANELTFQVCINVWLLYDMVLEVQDQSYTVYYGNDDIVIQVPVIAKSSDEAKTKADKKLDEQLSNGVTEFLNVEIS